MRKLQIRKYKDEVEFAQDLYAVSRLVSKNRKLIDELRGQRNRPYDARRELASEGFPQIIDAIRSLDDVLPNMSNWIASQAHSDIDTEQLSKLKTSVAAFSRKSKKIKSRFVSCAKVYSGQTSKRFRAFSNQVKVYIDVALSGVYEASDIDIMLMPVDNKSAVNVAVLSYQGIQDTSGFVYPKFFSYLADTDDGIEVRSSPFESFEYRPGEKISTAANASRYLLARFSNLNIHPPKGDA